MKQATHAWMAVRAVGLLQDDPATKRLADLLAPRVGHAVLGAWMPDLGDSKLGSGDIDNHVFKMGPYELSAFSSQPSAGAGSYQPAQRYVTPKADLLKRLGAGRWVASFLDKDTTLDQKWWGGSYMASPTVMQNIPNRTQALSITLSDYLILGDAVVEKAVPRTFGLSKMLSPDERTRAEQVALGFFMLSHFVADACMPCHCDARHLSSFDGKLHPQWEEAIESKVGTMFTSHQLSAVSYQSAGVLEAAKKLDPAFGITFDAVIPVIKDNDVWKELVAACRASFSVASIVAPPAAFPYMGKGTLPLQDVPADLLTRATSAIAHDSVLNIAIVWKSVWGRFGK